MAVASTLPPSAKHPLLIDGYMKSCVGGASEPNAGAASGAGAGAGTAAAAGAASGAASGAGTACAASGGAPRACAGLPPAGRCSSAPGTAPGAGTCATNWFTAVATFLESDGTAASPANTAAAAISVEAALVGSAAACWMAGPMLCTADKPGACNPSIGSGGAGSALASGATPPTSSAADEPSAATAPTNVVLIDDMVPPIRGCGCRCAPAVVTAGRTAASTSAPGLRSVLLPGPEPRRRGRRAPQRAWLPQPAQAGGLSTAYLPASRKRG